LSLAWLAPVSLSALLAGTFWLWRAEGRSIFDLGLHPIAGWPRNVGLGILIGVVLPMALTLVQAVSGWITLVPASLSVARITTILLLTIPKMAVVVAVEELVFRGFFLQYFQLSLGTSKAMLLSSLFWALLHLPDIVSSGVPLTSVAIGMVTFTVLGVALSIGFLDTNKTIWFAFGVHYGYNLSYSFLGSSIAVTYHAPRLLVGHPAWAPESGLLGLLLAAMTLVTVLQSTKQKTRIEELEEKQANIS